MTLLREVPPADGDAPPSGRSSRERLMPAPRRFLLRWVPGAKTRVDLGRRLLAPLVLAIVPLFWLLDATHRAAISTMGRNQGIFQYIAWAVRLGDVDYRDVRDVNGPLIHMIHMAGLALGGADEHRFHVLELGVTGISFALTGACLPDLLAGRRRVPLLERAAWAAATWVVLASQYQLYLYWNQGQRETFCDWFLLPSLGLQLMVMRARASASAARRIVLIAALSTITWAGKPSFAVFTVMQLGVLLFDHEIPLARRARFGWFALGGVLGAVPPMLYLLRYGDISAFVRLSLVEVPQVYRFIWAKSVQEIFGEDGPLTAATTGLACAALLLALVWTRALPRRALVLALAPLAGLANVVIQHKGFGYHFHPLTATTQLGFVVVVMMLWSRYRNAPVRTPLGRWMALGAIAAFAFYVASGFKGSAQTKDVWILAGGETPEKRAEREYFDSFKSYDFFPWEQREAARYLQDRTTSDARVQVYGMDPYMLFLAKRRSATPYIYAYDLTDDAALDGGWSNKPTEAQAFRIHEIRNEHERDMLARLRAAPPEAFVFIDHSPLVSYPDAWEDFRHCCSASATWVATYYHPARSFGGEVHVWMRDNLPGTDHEKGME